MVGTHKDSVGVHDGVETMGYGEHCAVHKLLPQGTLNDTISPVCTQRGRWVRPAVAAHTRLT